MAEVLIIPEDLTLGQKIRILRIARRWSQQDLADEALVTQGEVSSIERDCRVAQPAKQRLLRALELETTGDGGK